MKNKLYNGLSNVKAQLSKKSFWISILVTAIIAFLYRWLFSLINIEVLSISWHGFSYVTFLSFIKNITSVFVSGWEINSGLLKQELTMTNSYSTPTFSSSSAKNPLIGNNSSMNNNPTSSSAGAAGGPSSDSNNSTTRKRTCYDPVHEAANNNSTRKRTCYDPVREAANNNSTSTEPIIPSSSSSSSASNNNNPTSTMDNPNNTDTKTKPSTIDTTVTRIEKLCERLAILQTDKLSSEMFTEKDNRVIKCFFRICHFEIYKELGIKNEKLNLEKIDKDKFRSLLEETDMDKFRSLLEKERERRKK